MHFTTWGKEWSKKNKELNLIFVSRRDENHLKELKYYTKTKPK